MSVLPWSRFTFVLDLDGTLIHSEDTGAYVIEDPADNTELLLKDPEREAKLTKRYPPPHLKRDQYWVWFRPAAVQLIRFLQEKRAIVGVWTAASKPYATTICEALFAETLRPPDFLWTADETEMDLIEGLRISKPLAKLQNHFTHLMNIDTMVVLDDSPTTYTFNPDNAIPITPWRYPRLQNDTHLVQLMTYLEQGRFYNCKYRSVRTTRKRNWNNHE